mmetsp:Transcript_11583/g.34031  ORF Transcript_11583/g.34031 Transcript_11583/m.34031 type:complete len:430 (+) Transcript_11583:668-1957(+)
MARRRADRVRLRVARRGRQHGGDARQLAAGARAASLSSRKVAKGRDERGRAREAAQVRRLCGDVCKQLERLVALEVRRGLLHPQPAQRHRLPHRQIRGAAAAASALCRERRQPRLERVELGEQAVGGEAAARLEGQPAQHAAPAAEAPPDGGGGGRRGEHVGDGRRGGGAAVCASAAVRVDGADAAGLLVCDAAAPHELDEDGVQLERLGALGLLEAQRQLARPLLQRRQPLQQRGRRVCHRSRRRRSRGVRRRLVSLCQGVRPALSDPLEECGGGGVARVQLVREGERVVRVPLLSPEAVGVQLLRKRAELVVLEVAREHFAGEAGGVVDEEGGAARVQARQLPRLIRQDLGQLGQKGGDTPAGAATVAAAAAAAAAVGPAPRVGAARGRGRTALSGPTQACMGSSIRSWTPSLQHLSTVLGGFDDSF